MRKKQSVSKLILAVIAVGIILFSLAICFVVSRRLREGLVNHFTDEIKLQSVVITDEMANSLRVAEQTARWVQSEFEMEYPEKGYDRAVMNKLAEASREFFKAENIVFFNKWGMQLSSPKYGVVPKTNIISETLKGKETVRFDKTDAKIFGTVILPLKCNDEIFGVVEIRSEVATQELIDTVASYTNCDATIFNGEEFFVTSFEGMAGTTIQDPSIIERAEAGEETITNTVFNDHQYISYYFPFKDQEGNFLCTIFIGKDFEIANSVTYNIFKPLVIIIVFFTIALLVFLFVLFYRKMIKPLVEVNDAVANLSSGDADLTVRLKIRSKDEFGMLSDDVNKFIEKLQGLMRDLSASQSALNDVSQNLGINAQESASATAQILANIESVRHQSENQSSAVQNTNRVLGDSAESVDSLTNLINAQSAIISESSAAIEEMIGNISSVTESVKKMSGKYKHLSETVDNGQVKLGSVDQKVQQIAEQSKMLISANQIISQIASETNLLAMNAAIEAAHAGETGKGFSVVADEIRKLAENSSKQSKTISGELKKISESIDDVVTLSKDSQSAFSEIVTQLDSTSIIIQEITSAMGEQQGASKQILSSLGNMKEQSDTVSVRAKEMVDGISNVTTDMKTVNEISSTILGSMDEMTTGMQQIGNATQNVSDLAMQTKESIRTMNDKLNQFKI